MFFPAYRSVLYLNCDTIEHKTAKLNNKTRRFGVVMTPLSKKNWQTMLITFGLFLERPSIKGRPPTYYHPLLEKEKDLNSAIVSRILPKSVADTVCATGPRLAHSYGLPKTHRERLAMRPILSATQTYNYALAKLRDTKLNWASALKSLHSNWAIWIWKRNSWLGNLNGDILVRTTCLPCLLTYPQMKR